MSDPQEPLSPKKPSPHGAEAGPELAEDARSKALSDALHSSFAIVKVVMAALIVVFLGSGLRVVEPQEKAVILRFGRPVGVGEDALLGPGAHWAFPYPIDEIVRIPIGQIQTVRTAVGWYASFPTGVPAVPEPATTPSLNPNRDGYLLSGDENIFHLKGTLRYRITEPGLQFQFHFASSSNAVLDAFNNALIHTAARQKVDNILTKDVAGFREQVRARLDQLIVKNELGIQIDNIELETIPPRQLKDAFDAVGETEFNSGKDINGAKSYAGQTVSRAKAAAEAIRGAGESDRKRMVEYVTAESRRFEELLSAYERNPSLFRVQIQTEALTRILTNAQEKFLLPGTGQNNADQVRLQLGRKPQKLKNFQTAPAADH